MDVKRVYNGLDKRVGYPTLHATGCYDTWCKGDCKVSRAVPPLKSWWRKVFG